MKKVLIIGFVWPEPKSTGAGTRMLQLIQFFMKEEYQVLFASAALKSEFSEDLEKIGAEELEIQLNDSSFDDVLKEINPDIVLFDRFMVEEQYGWRVSENCPNALKVLDTEDLHCLRKVRTKAQKSKTSFDEELLLTSEIAKREVASIYRCDLTLVISHYEQQLLINLFKVPSVLLHYIPFMVQPVSGQMVSFDERKDFISIGNFLHEPNLDATLYLKETIWPLIRKELPNAKLLICGAYVPQRILQLHNEKEGFIVMGRIDSIVESFNKARLMLAPLRFGAGLKTKLVMAMQHGLPNVTTNIGVEGMGTIENWSGKVCDDPKDFAKAAIELYNSKVEWENAQSFCSPIINNLFNENKLSTLLSERLEELSSNLIEYRNTNFIGQLLQHHSMQSTKYMSKWIEEKNKR